MAIDSDTSLLSYYKNSYYVKLKEFRKGLVSHSQLLGYTLILIAQIKFAGNIILFIVRMGVQSLLGSPYGTKTQLDTVLSNYRQQWSSNDEADTKVKQFLRKSQVALLHLSLTLNFMVIVSGVIWPFDFESQLEHFKMPGIAHLENTPSAFNYRYNVIEGELRRNWFTQYIGERIPASNFRGNCSYLFYQLLILFAQLGLYLITVIELSPFNKTCLLYTSRCV